MGLLAVAPDVTAFDWLYLVVFPVLIGGFALIAPWLARRFIP